MHQFSCLLVLSAFLLSCSPAVQPDPHSESISRIEQSLWPALIIRHQEPPRASVYDRLAVHGVPGISVAVMLDGKFAWARGYGVADSAAGKFVTPQTLFQAASISKPVAAMAALEMVEKGKLTLDDDINSFLKSWQLPEKGFAESEKVTLRRILNHTAGTTVWGFPGYARSEDRISTRDVLAGHGNTDSVVVFRKPGESWRYSGGGYTVMQLAMEDVSEMDFASLMDELVLQPLGMTSSTFSQPLEGSLEDQAAAGYRVSGELVDMNWHVYPEQAAAGLWTTPTDLLKYAASVQRSYAGSKEEVLESDTAREMLTPGLEGHGLGPSISDEGSQFRHGGANEGYRCFLTASIEGGFAMVAMTNSDNGSRIAEELMTAIAEEYGWPDFKRDIRETIPLNPIEVAVLTGKYIFEEWGEVEIYTRNDTIMVRGGPLPKPTVVLAESPNILFDADEGTRLRFNIEDGVAVSLTAAGQTAVRVE